MGTTLKIDSYIETWKNRGYDLDIPDEVPEKLMQLRLAPSYRAICLTILKNDYSLKLLGVTPPKSKWYDEYKRIEIKERSENIQRK